MDNIIIDFKPTKQHLHEIEEWLRREDEEYSRDSEQLSYTEKTKGFLCNWSFVVDYFNMGQMAIALIDRCPVGFVVWSYPNNYKGVAKIQIAETKPDIRKYGINRTLLEHCFEYFKTKNIFAVHLSCISSESECTAKRIGFRPFPEGVEDNRRDLYLLLAESEVECTPVECHETIELIDGYSEHAKSKCCWPVRRGKNSMELISPIIAPAHPDWLIRWKCGDKVLCDKVKYFLKERDVSIENGCFIFINSLPIF